MENDKFNQTTIKFLTIVVGIYLNKDDMINFTDKSDKIIVDAVKGKLFFFIMFLFLLDVNLIFLYISRNI